ncbi:MAG: acyltransferase [Bacteroidales bacterium]|nr:acyltransferase [Candidatus Colimorpha onthohippi]
MLKKVNRLLLPFLFWHLLLSMALPVVLFACNTSTFSLMPAFDNFREIVSNGFPYNIALWFLFSLFVINILAFGLVWIVEKCRYDKFKPYLIIFLSILCGFVGWLLRRHSIAMPLYLDTALVSMPFFVSGYVANRYASILTSRVGWKSIVMLVVSFSSIVYLYIRNIYVLDLRTNMFVLNTLFVYLCSFAGIYFLTMLCKLVKHLPVVSYVGRYSIIILVLHCPLINLVAPLVDTLFSSSSIAVRSYIILVVVVALSAACIPLCKRFLPHFTAQKDLIKVG